MYADGQEMNVLVDQLALFAACMVLGMVAGLLAAVLLVLMDAWKGRR